MPNYSSSLSLDCIASDPTSTTLYGITTGYSDNNENEESFLLVKSSPNPDHVSIDMWSMVSEEKSKPFSYWWTTFRSIDCSVSSKGVFTAFFNNDQLLTPGTVSTPVGVRYDPETQEWTSIKTSPLYGWATDDWTHTSFYINNGGVESLVHLLTDADSTVIRFGVLNEAENVLQLASVWKQVSDICCSSIRNVKRDIFYSHFTYRMLACYFCRVSVVESDDGRVHVRWHARHEGYGMVRFYRTIHIPRSVR